MAFPQPPWHMHGRAFVQPFLVDARSVTLPDGFDAVQLGGRCVGMLALIEYREPSPLVYNELAWLPCAVRANGRRGYYIAKMYVDSDDSLAGGRALWAIPKQRARFAFDADHAIVDTEDGAHIELGFKRRGPALPLRAGAATLQARDGDVVRFRGKGKARTASGGLRVEVARGVAWTGWDTARRLPGLGAALTDFAIAMG